jgi:hypothetical protein
MVAVFTKQVGCVMVPVGATGLAGNGLTVYGLAAERQLVFTSRTVMLNVVLGAKPEKVALDWYEAPPLMLYSTLDPMGDDTTIVPVGVMQSG